jgi:outer membrane lipoprotein-sorting protein
MLVPFKTRSILMSRNKNLWILIGSVIFMAALISGFVLMQPSAQDILVNSLENTKTIHDGHAVIQFKLDSIDKKASGTFEVWAYRNEDETGGFRVEVLESSEEKVQGSVIVSDGDTLWAYSPSENKIFIGTPEEAKAMMENNEYFPDQFNEMKEHVDGETKDGEYKHPENAGEVVQELEQYFNLKTSGTETIAGETADQVKLEPIPDQMPDEYLAVGGFINLWVSQENAFPLAFEFTGSSLGEVSITVLEYEINTGVDDIQFTFDAPQDAEVVTFADLEPQSLTLDEAAASADYEFLEPGEVPSGATLVDIVEVRGFLVQRYALPQGGSFSVAQGNVQEISEPGDSTDGNSRAVEVRGTTGQLFESDDGSQILLTWVEGELVYSIAGDLTLEEAITVAESLQ